LPKWLVNDYLKFIQKYFKIIFLVTKPKGSGIETPTSEPGFCMTDMYDSECDEEYDEYFNRHQRRLSDPSSNLNNFSKNGWKTKNASGNSKALSQNEGLDSLANEMSEIEAGNVRDGNYKRYACCMLHFHQFAFPIPFQNLSFLGKW
jgi:hypothetical protein